MVENKVSQTLAYIDTRIENYSLPLFTQIVRSSTSDPLVRLKADDGLRTALRAANLFDFYYETDESSYKIEGWKQIGVLFHDFGPKDRAELEKLGNEIIRFFGYEKELWNRVNQGEKVSDAKIRRFLLERSSDALFYARILQVFVPQENLGPALHANMQMLDMTTDIREWEIDLKNGNPNMLFMFLSQENEVEAIKKLSTKEAVDLAKSQNVDKKFIAIADELMTTFIDFDMPSIDLIGESAEVHRAALTSLLGI